MEVVVALIAQVSKAQALLAELSRMIPPATGAHCAFSVISMGVVGYSVAFRSGLLSSRDRARIGSKPTGEDTGPAGSGPPGQQPPALPHRTPSQQDTPTASGIMPMPHPRGNRAVGRMSDDQAESSGGCGARRASPPRLASEHEATGPSEARTGAAAGDRGTTTQHQSARRAADRGAGPSAPPLDPQGEEHSGEGKEAGAGGLVSAGQAGSMGGHGASRATPHQAASERDAAGPGNSRSIPRAGAERVHPMQLRSASTSSGGPSAAPPQSAGHPSGRRTPGAGGCAAAPGRTDATLGAGASPVGGGVALEAMLEHVPGAQLGTELASLQGTGGRAFHDQAGASGGSGAPRRLISENDDTGSVESGTPRGGDKPASAMQLPSASTSSGGRSAAKPQSTGRPQASRRRRQGTADQDSGSSSQRTHQRQRSPDRTVPAGSNQRGGAHAAQASRSLPLPAETHSGPSPALVPSGSVPVRRSTRQHGKKNPLVARMATPASAGAGRSTAESSQVNSVHHAGASLTGGDNGGAATSDVLRRGAQTRLQTSSVDSEASAAKTLLEPEHLPKELIAVRNFIRAYILKADGQQKPRPLQLNQWMSLQPKGHNQIKLDSVDLLNKWKNAVLNCKKRPNELKQLPASKVQGEAYNSVVRSVVFAVTCAVISGDETNLTMPLEMMERYVKHMAGVFIGIYRKVEEPPASTMSDACKSFMENGRSLREEVIAAHKSQNAALDWLPLPSPDGGWERLTCGWRIFDI